jgi:hypothetical protein
MKLKLCCDFCKEETEITSYNQRPKNWHDIIISTSAVQDTAEQLEMNFCGSCSKRNIPTIVSLLQGMKQGSPQKV